MVPPPRHWWGMVIPTRRGADRRPLHFLQ